MSTHFQHWVWLLLNGIVSLVLGILIWRGWPETGYWVIGMFIGIDMLFYGWSLVMLSMGIRSLPAQTANSKVTGRGGADAARAAAAFFFRRTGR